MTPSRELTDEIFAAFLKCRYKAYLKLRGEVGEASDYARTQADLSGRYRDAAQEALVKQAGEVIETPSCLADAVRSSPALITDATAADAGLSCRIDALEKKAGRQRLTGRPCSSIARRSQPTTDCFWRLLLPCWAAFRARRPRKEGSSTVEVSNPGVSSWRAWRNPSVISSGSCENSRKRRSLPGSC